MLHVANQKNKSVTNVQGHNIPQGKQVTDPEKNASIKDPDIPLKTPDEKRRRLGSVEVSYLLNATIHGYVGK